MLQIGRKLKKWRWRHNFSTCVIVNFFWRCIVSLFRFSYWSKFHVNMVTRSGVMIISISFYKGLTRNLEIGNTPSEFCPISEDWGWVRNTKFGTNVSNKMLLNATKFQGYSFYRFWGIKGKPKLPPTPPRLGLKKNIIFCVVSVSKLCC